MIGKHLDRQTLERLLQRDLGPEEVARVGWHLIHCELCREKVEGSHPRGADPLSFLSRSSPPQQLRFSPASYEGVFSRVRQRLDDTMVTLQDDLQRGQDLASELLARPAAERRAAVERDERLRSRAVAENLLDRSRQQWSEDPLAAESMVELAQTVLDGLEGSGMTAAPLADLKAQCSAHAGNIRRIRSDLRSAEEAFAAAEAHLRQGTGDPVTRGEVLALKATLCRDQRRLDEALSLLKQAAAAFHKAGDDHLVGRVLLKKALVHNEAGDPAQSIATLRRAMKHIDARREPRLRLAAQEQLVLFLNQAGRHQEALALLPEAHQAAEEVGSRLDRLRVRWVEGLIAQDLGWYERAERALSQVRKGFVEEGIGYDAALVSLDLAGLYLRQGRTPETRQLALEMLPIFQSRDIHREALAALMVFRRAVEIETVTLGMVEDIAGYLKRARSNPCLTYEQPS